MKSSIFPTEIVGPYSPWPRRRAMTRGKMAVGTAVAGAAAFVHCIVPLL